MTHALMLLALAVCAASTAQAQSSADASRKSGTGVSPAGANGSKFNVQSSKSGRRADESEPGTVVTGSTSTHSNADRSAERVGSPRVSKGADVTAGSRHDSRQDAGAADVQSLINSCAAAVEDLAKTRVLVDALERENGLLKERLETEKRTSAVLLELNETRKSEAASLRETVTAKNETIVAKDNVIAAQDKLIGELKAKRSSPLKRLGDVLIGVAVAAIFR